MFIIMLLLTVFEKLLGKCFHKCSKDVTDTEDVTEDLDEYWRNITGKEQMEWYANELYQRSALRIKTLEDRSFEKLRIAKRGKKHFIGAQNYEILSNLKYCEQFQFQSVDMRNDKDDFEISDPVVKHLYVGEHFSIKDEHDDKGNINVTQE